MHAAVIEQLMCYFEIKKTWLNENFGKDAAQIVTLAKELVAANEDGYFVEREDSFRHNARRPAFCSSICCAF